MIFLGTLTANAGAGVNNHNTAAPFDIPDETHELYVETDTDGVGIEVGAGTGVNYDTFATTAARGKRLFGVGDPYFVEEFLAVPRFGRSPINAAPAWLAGHGYSAGDKVTANGWTWICVTSGNSSGGGSGPAYGTEHDGTVLWRPLERALDSGSTPYKTLARVAIFNPTVGTANVKVWAA